MSPVKRVGDLEIPQDLEFQRDAWRVQRIGWAAMTLIILGALFGLFGIGPLSDAEAASPGGDLLVDYQRFDRFNAQSDIRFFLNPDQLKDGKALLWIDRDYVDSQVVTSVHPQPDNVTALGDGYLYEFPVEAPGQTYLVTFNIRAENLGLLHGSARLGDGSIVRFQQFIYP